MENTIIKVGGMSCQGCVKNISGVLAGVVSAEVSLDAGEAKVAFDPQAVSRDALVGAIEDAGFDAE